MKLTLNQFRFLQRIGSNPQGGLAEPCNFNADIPTGTVNSVIDLGLAVKMDAPNYYQITQAGAELLAEIEWTETARYFWVISAI